MTSSQLELTVEIPWAYPAGGRDPYNTATTFVRWVGKLAYRARSA